MVQLQHNDTILFIGDSITDAGRREYFGANLGQGYVSMVAGHLYRQYIPLQLNIINKGVGGDRLADLVQRWEIDCLNLKPNVVSIQIGINDIWHRISAGLPYMETIVQQFKDNYDYLLKTLKKANIQIILLEPYVLPYPEKRTEWRPYVDKMIDIIHELAEEYGATLVRLDTPLNQAGSHLTYEAITGVDGVHPTSLGHAFIADCWLRDTSL
ncbi:SGNH/GDSL hydrolase family protein [Aerococcaceae bacterium WGS1372]